MHKLKFRMCIIACTHAQAIRHLKQMSMTRVFNIYRSQTTCADQEGGGGGVRGSGLPSPEKYNQNIGSLINTGPDIPKNHKATKPAFNVGPSSVRQRNAI